MPDEEEGFTFVDKRRTQNVETLESESGEPLSDRDEAPSFPASSEGADRDEDVVDADIYQILGYFTSLLANEAWQKLGLIANPQTGEAKADLPQARVAIDTIGDLVARLEAAPEISVPPQTRRELRNLLNDLRLNYVGRQNPSS
jgi:hypothetical protein